MTPDGAKIYFTTAEDLTEPEDTDTSVDLYMWTEEARPRGTWSRSRKATSPATGNTDACGALDEGCNVDQNSAVTSTDTPSANYGGYTTAQGGPAAVPTRTTSSPPATATSTSSRPSSSPATTASDGEENLYDYRNGKLQFVAALEPTGIACTRTRAARSAAKTRSPGWRRRRTTSHMAFLTASKVTGYDNAGHSEMYL